MGFATKPELAVRMLVRALDAGVPAAWVTGDEVYGASTRLRAELEARGVGYVLTVACHHPARFGGTTHRVDALLQHVPARAWQCVSAGAGAKGQRLYDWACLKDEFYARVRARGRVPDSERKLRDDLTTARGRIKELVAENNKLQEENDTLARIINVLEVERHGLRAGTGRTGQLVALPSANHR